jgi:hypothetical protein
MMSKYTYTQADYDRMKRYGNMSTSQGTYFVKQLAQELADERERTHKNSHYDVDDSNGMPYNWYKSNNQWN